MNPSVFLLSRLEFRRVDIESNSEYIANEEKHFFPQIDFDFNKVKFELGADLIYPDDEVHDPRHFTLFMTVSIQKSKQIDDIVLPYSVTISGTAYLHFRGKDEGLQRFKYVRGTGYSMLYSAFREQVANFTARSVHGLWFLPAPNFNSRVEAEAPKDFEAWEAAVSTVKKESHQPKRKASKKISQSKEI
jgi:hypothetical protein